MRVQNFPYIERLRYKLFTHRKPFVSGKCFFGYVYDWPPLWYIKEIEAPYTMGMFDPSADINPTTKLFRPPIVVQPDVKIISKTIRRKKQKKMKGKRAYGQLNSITKTYWKDGPILL